MNDKILSLGIGILMGIVLSVGYYLLTQSSGSGSYRPRGENNNTRGVMNTQNFQRNAMMRGERNF